jgi:hypothetical protein
LSLYENEEHDLSSMGAVWMQDKMLLLIFGSKDGDLTFNFVKKHVDFDQ